MLCESHTDIKFSNFEAATITYVSVIVQSLTFEIVGKISGNVFNWLGFDIFDQSPRKTNGNSTLSAI